MNDAQLEALMKEHGVRVTANRLVIVRALDTAGRPLSMTEIETMVDTIDKSNVFRALSVFRDAHLVHVLESSGEGLRYELCHSHASDVDEDLHVHFYCEKCHRTYCLEDVPVPSVSVPSGFFPRSANYLLRGLCPSCSNSA